MRFKFAICFIFVKNVKTTQQIKTIVVCFDSQPSFSSYGTNKGITCFR